MKTPFQHSYWVVPGKFLAGPYPGFADPAEAESLSKAFLDHGLRSFIDLTEPGEMDVTGTSFIPYAPALKAVADRMGIETLFYRYGIEDYGVPAAELMILILDTIDRSIGEDRPAYIHCRGGIGRTGTVVGCYLVRHGYASGEDALTVIHDLRRFTPFSFVRSPESAEQREMVKSWSTGR